MTDPIADTISTITSDGWQVAFLVGRHAFDISISRSVRSRFGAPYVFATGRAQGEDLPSTLALALANAESAADLLEETTSTTPAENPLLSMITTTATVPILNITRR